MMPTTPYVYYPHSTSSTNVSLTYSSNRTTLRILGYADEDTVSVSQNYLTDNITFLPVGEEGTDDLYPGQWSLDLVNLSAGEHVYYIRAHGADSTISSSVVITLRVILDQDLGLTVECPTGISIDRYSDRVRFTLTYTADISQEVSGVVGFNFYASDGPAGGSNGYILLNAVPVSSYEDTRDVLISSDTSTDTGDLVDGVYTETVTAEKTYRRYYTYIFDHRRTDGPEGDYPSRQEAYDLFSGISESVGLYYVVTAVGYDSDEFVEVESVYSSELVGLPLMYTTEIVDLNPRSLSDMQKDSITNILRLKPKLDVKPGSVIRDVVIDTPSYEIQKLWFLADFIHRTQSFLTLLEIDDPDRTGSSVPVSDSRYKTALSVALSLSASDTQALIDSAFEKLASNSLTYRRSSTKAKVNVVFQRSQVPVTDITIPSGTLVSTKADSINNIPSVSFLTTSSKTMYASRSSSYYNSSSQRYELIVSAEAVIAGSGGNIGAGFLKTHSAVGFTSVTNRSSALYGEDRESNLSLAEVSMRSYAGVDSGTYTGYEKAALKVNGTKRVKVISAGDPLMGRDYDDVRDKHLGGKVDVWVKGTTTTDYTEVFAFRYLVENNIRFNVINAGELIFRTTSPNVTPTSPLFSMLTDSSRGYGLRNLTTGSDFDLTDVTIVDYRTIQLSSEVDQPSVSSSHLISGDYRYRDSDPFVPVNQPVFDIVSISSESSNLTPDNFKLYKTEDPLLLGCSTKASDHISITQYGGIPTGDSEEITNESLVLVGSDKVNLASVGIDLATLIVTNVAGTVTYISDRGEGTPDYYITEGSLTTVPSIARNPNGRITSGQEVYASYTREENFTIVYTSDSVLQKVKESIEVSRHLTADVAVKTVITNKVSLSATVVMKPGAAKTQVEMECLTELSKLDLKREIGQDLHQSEVITALSKVKGVAYVVNPLTSLYKSDGSLIVRNVLDSDSVLVAESPVARVYILTQELDFSTQEGGGEPYLPRGVFQDSVSLSLYTMYSSFDELEDAPGRAMIIGSDGIAITGYSTSNTKQSLTSNRILVSLPPGESPDDYVYSVTYQVYGEQGSSDVTCYDIEHLSMDEGGIDLVLTYDSDRYTGVR